MTDKVSPIPAGFHSITPYLCIKNAADAIEFYKKAFGAVEVMRMAAPDGRIGHAEIKIGDSHLMISDEYPEMNFRSPQTIGGSPVFLMVYVEDVDAVVQQSIDTGATLQRPIADQFYGDRTGSVEDPFGYTWFLSTHIEDVPLEELEKRAAAAHQNTAECGSPATA